MSASRPCTSGSSGMSSASARPSRMASAARSPRPVYPSLKIRYTTASTAASRSGSRWSGGTRNGMPAARILAFARTSRCAIVGSATRNARAISGVVSPPSVRRVSATCASSGERRVAAREDQLQPLVLEGRLVHRVLRCLRHLEQPRLGRQRPVAPDAVDGPVARRGHEPHRRVVGDAVARPALRRDGERLLGGLLGEVEVAEEADQGSEDASPLVAEGLLEDRYHSTIGRTSTAPPRRAAGMRDASSIAASRSSASKIR